MKKDVNTKDVNSYIAEDNDKGMKETALDIIKNGKKVKIYGNEFDFSGVTKIEPDDIYSGKLKINGEEVDVSVVFYDDGYVEIEIKQNYANILFNKNYANVFFNKKRFKATKIVLKPDFSIEEIVDKDNQTFVNGGNYYQYDSIFDDSTITGNKQQLYKKYKLDETFHVFDRVEPDENNNLEEFKTNFLKSLKKESEYYDVYVFFAGENVYVAKHDYRIESGGRSTICRYKKTDKGYEQYGKELDIMDFAKVYKMYVDDDKDNITLIMDIGREYKYVYSPHQISVVDMKNNQITSTLKRFDGKLNDEMSIERINFKKCNLHSIEQFDKMLKKYFDKCVKEEQKKEHNPQNNKQNDLYNNQKEQETQNGEVKTTERKKNCIIF